jgi:hypothetical protein
LRQHSHRQQQGPKAPMRHILLAPHLLFTAINIYTRPRPRPIRARIRVTSLINSNDLDIVRKNSSVNLTWLYLLRLCSTSR